ncbi:putative peroxiredoxin, partial [Sporormia fimetaria CBS 119925]
MPVELRKRKTPPPAPARASKKKADSKTKRDAEESPDTEKSTLQKATEAVTGTVSTAGAVKDAVVGSNGSSSSSNAPKVGETINLSDFGGEVETHEGQKTTLAKLVEESKSGVVLFTYPKASTPGCTKQVCHFRDSHTPLTASGFSIYGLSNDSPKANTTFHTKQNLNYPLLCDPERSLINAIGLKGAKGTTRGIFIVDKQGKVLAAESGSPDGTLKVAQDIIGSAEGEGQKKTSNEGEGQNETSKEGGETA